MKLEADEHHRHKDVYQHSLQVLDQAIDHERSRHPGEAPDLVLRLAALLHDIGKPSTRRLSRAGSSPSTTTTWSARRWRSAACARSASTTTPSPRCPASSSLHLRFFGYTEGGWTDSAVRRYVRDAGPELERLHMLTRADVTTQNRRKADRLGFAYDDLETRIAEPRRAGGDGGGAPGPRRRGHHADPRRAARPGGGARVPLPPGAAARRGPARRGRGHAPARRVVGGRAGLTRLSRIPTRIRLVRLLPIR
ncbi:HDIG domain-containing metalloprotein [Clavibacter tessellarius]|uniref:HDIG domain-containing metalloprotein n=1 Tax=Clavibacter tessellarius TaxID=31965 RepID=UPI0032496AAE